MHIKVTSINIEKLKNSHFFRGILTLETKISLMKLFRKDSATCTIPSMQHSDDGTCADNKLDNANMLNNYFSKCFTASLPPLYGSFESAEHLELYCLRVAQKICYVQRRRL